MGPAKAHDRYLAEAFAVYDAVKRLPEYRPCHPRPNGFMHSRNVRLPGLVLRPGKSPGKKLALLSYDKFISAIA